VFQFDDEKSFKKCDFSKATQRATESPYMFSTTKPGTYYFACSVDKHCKENLKLKFQVVSAGSPTTSAPLGIFLAYVY